MTTKGRGATGEQPDLTDERVASGTLEVDVVSPTRSTDLGFGAKSRLLFLTLKICYRKSGKVGAEIRALF